MEERVSKRPWLRAFVNAFILFHLYIMAMWGLPGSRFRAAMTRPIEGYVIHSGLWHSWDMFSPDPLALNFNVVAEIVFRDGRRAQWEFPRMEKLGLWERFQKERFRKWRERVRQDIYAASWEDTARYVARLHRDASNPPVRVELVRHWQPIPPPEAPPGRSKPRDYQPMPKGYELKFNYRFKVYEVKPGDL